MLLNWQSQSKQENGWLKLGKIDEFSFWMCISIFTSNALIIWCSPILPTNAWNSTLTIFFCSTQVASVSIWGLKIDMQMQFFHLHRIIAIKYWLCVYVAFQRVCCILCGFMNFLWPKQNPVIFFFLQPNASCNYFGERMIKLQMQCTNGGGASFCIAILMHE